MSKLSEDVTFNGKNMFFIEKNRREPYFTDDPRTYIQDMFN